MKNQYLGDVGDYGKYGMLRFFARNNIRIAVNWYLTPDDGSTDGKHITYLNNNVMLRYDEKLFDLLAAMVRAGDRNVITFEEQDAISGATYNHQLLHDEGKSRSDKSAYRDGWHKAALEASKDAELVFLDPDNGACEKEAVNKKIPSSIVILMRLLIIMNEDKTWFITVQKAAGLMSSGRIRRL